MAEQVLDRPADMLRAAGDSERSPVALIPGWRCIADAVIRAYGEEGPVDLAALHPARGLALIAFLDEGEEASPEVARDAMRAMLRDEGLERRFPGELPIVALPVPRAARGQIATTVEQAFAALPAPTLPEGWVEWIADRLAAERPPVPAAPRLLAPCREESLPEKVVSALLLSAVAEPPAAAAGPRLAAPQRDEPTPTKPAGAIALAAPARQEPEPEKAAPDSGIAAPTEAPPASEMEPRQNWLDWGATLGFALGMVAALIAGLTAVLRNGRLF